MPAPADPRAGRAAFGHPAFVLFQTARFLIVAAVEMQAVAVGWQVYEITKKPLDLGLVALAQRRGVQSVTAIYVVLVLLGVVRSFNSTASRSILPQLVPEEHFPNAVAWNATIFQAATILGPSFGGFLYALSRGPSAVYATALVTAVGALISTFRIRPHVNARRREGGALKAMTLKTVF